MPLDCHSHTWQTMVLFVLITRHVASDLYCLYVLKYKVRVWSSILHSLLVFCAVNTVIITRSFRSVGSAQNICQRCPSLVIIPTVLVVIHFLMSLVHLFLCSLTDLLLTLPYTTSRQPTCSHNMPVVACLASLCIASAVWSSDQTDHIYFMRHTIICYTMPVLLWFFYSHCVRVAGYLMSYRVLSCRYLALWACSWLFDVLFAGTWHYESAAESLWCWVHNDVVLRRQNSQPCDTSTTDRRAGRWVFEFQPVHASSG